VEALRDFLTGKGIAEVPPLLMEYMVAKHFGWTLEYIRNLPEDDFENFSRLAILGESYKNADIINVMGMTFAGKKIL
jgi:hypothetical protein